MLLKHHKTITTIFLFSLKQNFQKNRTKEQNQQFKKFGTRRRLLSSIIKISTIIKWKLRNSCPEALRLDSKDLLVLLLML